MSNTRPNILLLVADQHRFDAVGCYGNSDIITPTLDTLAEEGTLFEACYVQNPICSPSRASLATGLYPRNHGLWANGVELAADKRMISRALADAGYDCGMAGKQHLGPCAIGDEVRRDDGYRVYKWSHDPIHRSPNNAYHRWLEENHPDIHEREVLNRSLESPEAGNVAKGATPMDVLPVDAHYSHWIAEEVISFINDDSRDDDQPFYFMANFFDPHHPFGAPAEFRALYDADSLAAPIGSIDELSEKPSVQREYSEKSYGGHAPGFAEYTKEELQEARASYYAMVSMIDAEIRRIIEALKARGELDNTLVIYTSDHGEMLGDHAMMLKGPMLYEPTVRVPLIMRWPDALTPGTRVSQIVQNIDITSTLLTVAGIPNALPAQGSDLIGLSNGTVPEWRDWALCEYRDSGHGSQPPTHTTMLRHRHHKLIVWHGEPASARPRDGEIYDLAADPHELSNLFHRPEHRELREHLKDVLIDVLDATEDRQAQRLAEW